jgi:predicted RNA-binding Zn-ribbon protein involved in translation (DUF1610 family)
MGFLVKQECPQCGGPVELDETDHILQCPYCDVKSFLFSDEPFRFVLPHKTQNKEILYVPYLRFRGVVYTCRASEVIHRIVDISRLAVPLKHFPISLGLRPQTMKMRFVSPETEGSFLKCFLKISEMLARAEKQSSAGISDEIFHRAHVGEAINLIYLPLYLEKGALFDAITHHPVARLPRDREKFSSITENTPPWALTFLATLCPRCGWNLEGKRDSVVLICSNCQTAWEARRGRFVSVDFRVVSEDFPSLTYLPFWKMSVRTEGVAIGSFADFIRITNQPRIVQKAWHHQDMTFWTPAFKIRPKLFLAISRRLTLAQENLDGKKDFPDQTRHPVTLPLAEAIQGIKLTLAHSTVNKKEILPKLPQINMAVKGATLMYLPFQQTAHEMIQPHTGLAINKKSLEFGRYL